MKSDDVKPQRENGDRGERRKKSPGYHAEAREEGRMEKMPKDAEAGSFSLPVPAGKSENIPQEAVEQPCRRPQLCLANSASNLQWMPPKPPLLMATSTSPG